MVWTGELEEDSAGREALCISYVQTSSPHACLACVRSGVPSWYCTNQTQASKLKRAKPAFPRCVPPCVVTVPSSSLGLLGPSLTHSLRVSCQRCWYGRQSGKESQGTTSAEVELLQRSMTRSQASGLPTHRTPHLPRSKLSPNNHAHNGTGGGGPQRSQLLSLWQTTPEPSLQHRGSQDPCGTLQWGTLRSGRLLPGHTPLPMA